MNNDKRMAGVAMVVGMAALALGWMALPSLQSSTNAVESEAAGHLERARRLLHQYDPELAYRSLLVERMVDENLDVDADDISENVTDEYQETHGLIWSAYPPQDRRGGRASDARANYGNIAGQIRDGLRAQAELAASNHRLLDEADRAIDETLALSSGDASARSHAEANRLKAVIQYHKGLAQWSQAQLVRSDANEFRAELSDLGAEARALAPTETDSKIEDGTALLSTEIARVESSIGAESEALRTLDELIRERETRLAAAQASSESAREAMEQLKEKGGDFSDPDGREAFRTKMEKQDRIFREADRTVRKIEHGSLTQAKLELGGDYLTGRYVENGSFDRLTPGYGLRHYRNDRVVLAGRLDSLQQRLDNLKAGLSRIADGVARRESLHAEDAKRRTTLTEIAADTYAEMNRLDAEAHTLEDEALTLLDAAGRTARQAAQYAGRWVSDARSHTQDLSPESKARSAFATREKAGWLGGFIEAQEADALLAKAWIQYDRFRAYSATAKILTQVGEQLALAEADVEAERAKADEAREEGVAGITAAVKSLEGAHRKTGKHWTLSAQAAGTTYLMVLFGYGDYLADTVEGYRAAVKGRESDKNARPFVSRLAKLEGR